MRTGVFTVRHGDEEHRVTVSPAGEVRVDDAEPLTVAAAGPSAFRVREGDRARQVFVAASGGLRQAFVDGDVYEFTVDAGQSPRSRGARHAADTVCAPMPARVSAVLVEAGQHVGKGDVLLKLEAMKMELPVRAPHEGTVTAVLCRAGELVQPGITLVELA
jgi:biotin carboxyl carrier protein